MNNEFGVELSKGLFAGRDLYQSLGWLLYSGGRYAHFICNNITPAKVAGVKTIICASPPKDKNGAHPGIIYANLAEQTLY